MFSFIGHVSTYLLHTILWLVMYSVVLRSACNVMLQPKTRMASTQNAWLKFGWMNTNGCTIFIVPI